MKTNYILILVSFGLLIINNSYSQQNKDSSSNLSIPYNKILDREFTRILTGQSTNFGTYAALGTKDDIASLSGHIPVKNKSSIGINMRGGVTEGIVSLLNGEDVNSNISFGIQFNWGIYNYTKKKNFLLADATQMQNFLNTVDSLSQITIQSRDKIDDTKQEINLSLRKKELSIKQKNRELTNLINQRKEIIANISLDSINVLILTMENEVRQLKRDTSYLNHQLLNYTDDMIARQKQNLENNKVQKYNNESKNLSLIAYNLKWFSISTNLQNRTFTQFDDSLDFDHQLNKRTFNNFELGINYNQYHLRDKAFGSYYFSVGASFLYEDNFNDLNKITLNQKQVISTSPSTRSIESTKTVYSGDYLNGISKLKVSFNSYWFFTYKQSFAFHFNPSFRTKFNDIKLDLIAGFLVGFENQDKKNTILNAELFYNMKDLFHKSINEDDQFSDRADLGIRLSFPINFNQKL
jgi:hypothetical protein